MVFVIMSSAVSRNQAGRSWWSKGIAFSVSCALVGAGVGAALGTAGALLGPSARDGVVTLLSAVGLVAGLCEAVGRAARLFQCDRETSQRLLARGAIRGAIANGCRLGHGMTTRIGFSLWYAVPVAAFAVRDPRTGAAIYGMYGFVRGICPWLLITFSAAWHGGRSFSRVARFLLGARPTAQRACGVVLVLVAGAAFVTVGL